MPGSTNSQSLSSNSFDSPISTLTSMQSLKSAASMILSEIEKKSDQRIVFVFENNRAPVSCRSFESIDSPLRRTQMSVSIAGFRIIQDDSGEHAEFKIKTLINNTEVIGWKRFADFKELANACQEFSSGNLPSSWSTFFHRSPSYRLVRHYPNSIDLRESLQAWDRVLESRFWGWTFSNNLSVQRLMEDSQNFESFLRNILFEIPSPEILIEFMSSD